MAFEWTNFNIAGAITEQLVLSHNNQVLSYLSEVLKD